MGNAITPQREVGDRILALIRQKYPEYHPLLAIAEMAHDDKIEDPRLKLDCHKTIVKYVTPELKSVEIKADVTEHRRVVVSLFDGSGDDLQPLDAKPAEITYDQPQLIAKEPDPLWGRLVDVEKEALAA